MKRIPRTMGVTNLLQKGHREAATKLIIKEYITNNFTINGYQYTLTEVAKMIGKNEAYVIKEITKPMKAFLDQGEQKDTYAAVIGLLTNFALADRQLFLSQHGILANAQGGKYKPFISGTLVANFKNFNEWTGQMIKIATLLKPDAKVQNADQSNINPGKYLGTNEAVRLIDAERNTPLLTDGNNPLKERLLNDEALKELPEIIATKQQGISFDGNTEKRKRVHNKDIAKEGYSEAIIIP